MGMVTYTCIACGETIGRNDAAVSDIDGNRMCIPCWDDGRAQAHPAAA